LTDSKKLVATIKGMGSILALVLLILVMSIALPPFRTVNNIMLLLRQASINGLIAFGMTCVILTGGIDLSVGSILALTSIFAALMLVAGIPELAMIILVLLSGFALGAVNGLCVTKLRLQPFIATLIGMAVFRGLALIFSDGRPISGLSGLPVLDAIGRGFFIYVPVPVWILGIMFCLFFFILNNTTLGRRIYAVGSNATAAQLAGVSITKTKLFVYSMSGLMAAMGGLILLSRLGSAQPTLGIGYELDAIAAVALGGTSMSGGRGRIYGTVAGVLIIAILSNGLNIMGVPSFYQEVVKGIVILLAVLSDPNR